MIVFAKTFDHYDHKFNFDNFFSCPVKLKKNLKLKFRSKFNHDFTNHGYLLHSAVWKVLYNFKIKESRIQDITRTNFLDKFDPKSQNCQLKLKFGTKTNSNMLNSMMMFTFFVSNYICPSWENLIQKFKIAFSKWNLIRRLIL